MDQNIVNSVLLKSIIKESTPAKTVGAKKTNGRNLAIAIGDSKKLASPREFWKFIASNLEEKLGRKPSKKEVNLTVLRLKEMAFNGELDNVEDEYKLKNMKDWRGKEILVP